MRISDLSRKSGVPVATIKFYLREKLLPPGTLTGRNQAIYGDVHLRRLLLIRSFTNIAQLDLSSVGELLSAIADDGLPLPGLYEAADRAVFGVDPSATGSAEVNHAKLEVNEFLDKLGWRISADTPAAGRLAQVLVALRALGCECGIEFFEPCAQAAERFAAQELDLVPEDLDRTERAPAVVRSVMLGVATAALHRMAREHLVNERFANSAVTHGSEVPQPAPVG